MIAPASEHAVGVVSVTMDGVSPPGARRRDDDYEDAFGERDLSRGEVTDESARRRARAPFPGRLVFNSWGEADAYFTPYFEKTYLVRTACCAYMLGA